MKYKLIKYNDSIKYYIDINGLLMMYNILGKKIIKKREKIYNVINKNDNIELYKNLVIKIENIIRSDDKLNKKHNEINTIIQRGGQIPILPLILSGISSSIIVTSIVGYVLYRYFTAPKCRESYPLYPSSKVPQIKDIIIQLIPQNVITTFVPNFEKINLEEVIKSLRNSLEIFSLVLSFIAPDSLIGKAISSIVEIVAGVAVTAATVVTAGAATVINYLLKILNILKSVFALLIKFIDAIVKSSVLLDDDDSKRVIYDLFSIDFRDGPFGVKCWVDYIMNKYGKDTEFVKHICQILIKMLDVVYDKLIEFISRMLTISIPDGGVSGVLISGFISLLKCKTFDMALLKLTQAYDKISYDKQILFERPQLMKKMLDDSLEKGHKFFTAINDATISKIGNLFKFKNVIDTKDFNIYDFLKDNTGLLAFAINKILALVFMMLNIFSMCAKKGYCSFI